MPPGDMSLAVAGAARPNPLPPGIVQAGPATGVVELRGGLPPGRLEAGWTLQIPWTMMWDLKGQLVEEGAFLPAVTARIELGLVQPDYGGALLVSKGVGPVTLTLMGGRSRTYERLWRDGRRPFSDQSESFIKSVWSWGAGADWEFSPSYHAFLEGVSWNPDGERESPKTGRPFGVTENANLTLAAGLRMRWHLAPPPAPRDTGALTALRGYVLADPTADGFEVGQPGIYHATVLVDTRTQFVADGKPVDRALLARGRAVLIQGIAMPRPSTFLAHVVELQ
jgi:hypothetical protein